MRKNKFFFSSNAWIIMVKGVLPFTLNTWTETEAHVGGTSGRSFLGRLVFGLHEIEFIDDLPKKGAKEKNVFHVL